MKLSDLTAGCEVHADTGFTCLRSGIHIVEMDEGRPFIACDDGKHFLEGQEDENGDIVGINGAILDALARNA